MDWSNPDIINPPHVSYMPYPYHPNSTWWRNKLCSSLLLFLQPSGPSLFLGPNILFSTLFSSPSISNDIHVPCCGFDIKELLCLLPTHNTIKYNYIHFICLFSYDLNTKYVGDMFEAHSLIFTLFYLYIRVQLFIRCLWCCNFFLSLHLRRVPSGILQACHPSLTCSILFQQCIMLHCCKILVYFKTFTLRNQLPSSHSWMWKNITIITSK
jgi:hypothetical protein